MRKIVTFKEDKRINILVTMGRTALYAEQYNAKWNDPTINIPEFGIAIEKCFGKELENIQPPCKIRFVQGYTRLGQPGRYSMYYGNCKILSLTRAVKLESKDLGFTISKEVAKALINYNREDRKKENDEQEWNWKKMLHTSIIIKTIK